MVKLVLQRLGACRNNGLAATHQRRQQIRECLAGAGTGLDDKLPVLC
jgi:hypothetical protein